MTQTIQQAQQPQPVPSNDYDRRLVGVEKDVSGLKESMTALASTVNQGFSNVSAEMKAQRTTNWQPIGIAAAAILALSGWGFSLFGNYQARTDAAILEIKTMSQSFVPRQDIADRLQIAKERRDDAQRMTDARIERVERDVDNNQKLIVPRGEHEQTWASQRVKDDGIQRQLDELRKGLTDLNTPRDTIQGMQRRIDELERERRRGAS